MAPHYGVASGKTQRRRCYYPTTCLPRYHHGLCRPQEPGTATQRGSQQFPRRERMTTSPNKLAGSANRDHTRRHLQGRTGVPPTRCTDRQSVSSHDRKSPASSKATRLAGDAKIRSLCFRASCCLLANSLGGSCPPT